MGTRKNHKSNKRFRKTRSKRQRGGANLIRTNQDIKRAVNLWCGNHNDAVRQYGLIGAWDVSSVTNMKRLFEGKTTFNDDISKWDVSNVTDMSKMFHEARGFNNGGVDTDWNWKVSKVTAMNGMFANAQAFNQPIGNWDVSSVTNMNGMFHGATVFNQPIGKWKVSKVTNMSYMFYQAIAFNEPIGNWDVSSVTNMKDMFYGIQTMAYDKLKPNVERSIQYHKDINALKDVHKGIVTENIEADIAMKECEQVYETCQNNIKEKYNQSVNPTAAQKVLSQPHMNNEITRWLAPTTFHTRGGRKTKKRKINKTYSRTIK